MSWSFPTEVFVCILPLLCNEQHKWSWSINCVSKPTWCHEIAWKPNNNRGGKVTKILSCFISFSLTCCLCFSAKPSENCPKCVQMKVGGVCRGSNIGKSTGSRDLSFKIESQRFYDTMFIKVYETSDERNFISRLRVVLLTPSPLGVIVNKPQGKQTRTKRKRDYLHCSVFY